VSKRTGEHDDHKKIARRQQDTKHLRDEKEHDVPQMTPAHNSVSDRTKGGPLPSLVMWPDGCPQDKLCGRLEEDTVRDTEWLIREEPGSHSWSVCSIFAK
jgi:hypothetical protein